MQDAAMTPARASAAAKHRLDAARLFRHADAPSLFDAAARAKREATVSLEQYASTGRILPLGDTFSALRGRASADVLSYDVISAGEYRHRCFTKAAPNARAWR